MARDESRRPTPRQKPPKVPKAPKPKAEKPKREKAPKAPKQPKAPKPSKAPKPQKPKVEKPRREKAPKATKRSATGSVIGAAVRPSVVSGAQGAKGPTLPKAPAIPKAPARTRDASRPQGGSARMSLIERAAQARAAAKASSGSASPREKRERYQRGQALKALAIGAGALVCLALVALVAFFVLRDSSVFEITSIEAEPTLHVTKEDVSNLVDVPEGSTLLNVDTAAIEASLKKNPWVGSVGFERVFPHTLRLTIFEQQVDALVIMSSGSLGWYLGSEGVWIQPASFTVPEGQSVDDAALARAMEEGCVLITDVPATVSPVAGSIATDDVLEAVEEFRSGFSPSFASQVVSYSAPSPESVSCTLKSGVEVLLGSPTDIDTKEQIVTRYLEEHPGTITYINVRVVTNPAVRLIDSENVQPGTGVLSEGTGA